MDILLDDTPLIIIEILTVNCYDLSGSSELSKPMVALCASLKTEEGEQNNLQY